MKQNKLSARTYIFLQSIANHFYENNYDTDKIEITLSAEPELSQNFFQLGANFVSPRCYHCSR